MEHAGPLKVMDVVQTGSSNAQNRFFSKKKHSPHGRSFSWALPESPNAHFRSENTQAQYFTLFGEPATSRIHTKSFFSSKKLFCRFPSFSTTLLCLFELDLTRRNR